MAEFLAKKPGDARYFGNFGAEIEKLRRSWPADAPLDMVETSYFGFYVREKSLVCQIYHWFHPVSGVATDGAPQ